MRQALDIYWQYEGPATEGALEALNYLLSLHHALRDDTALLSTQRDALRAFDMALGPSRPETQRQVAAYAQTLVTTGRVAEADALFTQWLDRLRGGDGTLALQAAELERLRAEHLQATGR